MMQHPVSPAYVCFKTNHFLGDQGNDMIKRQDEGTWDVVVCATKKGTPVGAQVKEGKVKTEFSIEMS